MAFRYPANAAIPAVDARRHTLAQLTGRRIVEMVKQDLRMSQILTRAAFQNAVRANAAIGVFHQRRHPLDRHCLRIRRPCLPAELNTLASHLPCLVGIFNHPANI